MPTNQGQGNARRRSLAACTHELVALMDADDISWYRRFELQLQRFLSNPSLDIVGGQISEFIGTVSNIVSRRVVPEHNDDIVRYARKRCPMNQVSVMFKQSAYQKAGGYEDWYCNEDYFLWLRMMLRGCKFANVAENLVNVRIGDAMSARRGGWRYFQSEAQLQRFMLSNKIINPLRFCYNVAVRFGGEVVLPTSVRTKVFKFFRDNPNADTSNNMMEQDAHKTHISKADFPPFSVAMCVYGKDNPDWFDQALYSVVNQSVAPNEIVLVVDGPIPQALQDVIDRYTVICGGGG